MAGTGKALGTVLGLFSVMGRRKPKENRQFLCRLKGDSMKKNLCKKDHLLVCDYRIPFTCDQTVTIF